MSNKNKVKFTPGGAKTDEKPEEKAETTPQPQVDERDAMEKAQAAQDEAREAEEKEAERLAKERAKMETAMGFLGEVNKYNRRDWKAPGQVNGFRCSGAIYTFALPSGRDYALAMKRSDDPDELEGLDKILENPKYCMVSGTEDGKVDFDKINMFELERLRSAFLYFLSNGTLAGTFNNQEEG